MNDCVQDNLSSPVAGITEGDYRMDGKMELITATTDGESGGMVWGESARL